MTFKLISLMPDLIIETLKYGVVGKAFQKKLCRYEILNPREFTNDVHQTVDDRPFGGGDGMLMMAEPLQKALEQSQSTGPIYYLSPQGEVFNDSLARELSQKSELTLICGRYGGVDQRFLNKNKIQEISIGDYVLSGGELAATVVIDAIARHLPGVLGHCASASEDSFSQGFFEAPHFTRPREWQGMSIPSILLSGDHQKILQFKSFVGIAITLLKRPELLESLEVNGTEVSEYCEGVSTEDWSLLGVDKMELIKKLKEKFNGTS